MSYDALCLRRVFFVAARRAARLKQTPVVDIDNRRTAHYNRPDFFPVSAP